MIYRTGRSLKLIATYAALAFMLVASVFLTVFEFSPAAAEQAQRTTGTEEHDALFGALQAAKSEREARQIEDQIWRHWMAAAPDAETGRLLRDAMDRRESFDLEGAHLILTEAIERSPDTNRR